MRWSWRMQVIGDWSLKKSFSWHFSFPISHKVNHSPLPHGPASTMSCLSSWGQRAIDSTLWNDEPNCPFPSVSWSGEVSQSQKQENQVRCVLTWSCSRQEDRAVSKHSLFITISLTSLYVDFCIIFKFGSNSQKLQVHSKPMKFQWQTACCIATPSNSKSGSGGSWDHLSHLCQNSGWINATDWLAVNSWVDQLWHMPKTEFHYSPHPLSPLIFTKYLCVLCCMDIPC